MDAEQQRRHIGVANDDLGIAPQRIKIEVGQQELELLPPITDMMQRTSGSRIRALSSSARAAMEPERQ